MHDPETIRDCASQIETLDARIAELNAEKAKVYARARDAELDLPALRRAIALNRADDDQRKAFAERNRLVADYLKAIRSGDASRARAPMRESASSEVKSKATKSDKRASTDPQPEEMRT